MQAELDGHRKKAMWIVEALNKTVIAEIAALPDDIRARLVRYAEQIETFGPQGLPPKAFKFLGDRLWEIRLQGRDGIGRAIYVTAVERRVIIVRAFVKKAQKTPAAEPRLARSSENHMTRLLDLHHRWMKNPDYAREYEALEEEFSLAGAVAQARLNAGLTQADLATRMNTTQSVVARLEGGSSLPSTRTLKRIASATGTRLRISFEPNPQSRDSAQPT